MWFFFKTISHTVLRELLLGRPTSYETLEEPRYFWSVNHASLFSFIERMDDLANLGGRIMMVETLTETRLELVDRKSTLA